MLYFNFTISITGMSIIDSTRCVGSKRDGGRCARITRRTNLCYQHLQMQSHLAIKKSNIPAAGFGLFTTIHRKKGENVAPYSGKVVVSHDPDYGGPYALQIKKHPPTFIDASHSTSGAGRFCNNCQRGQCTNNTGLSINNNTKQASVRANRNIPAGKEIYTAYGRDYWK